MGRSVGIDLGTTNSVVAVLEGGDPLVIASAEGSRTTPSIVAWSGDAVLVGEVARRQAITNPVDTFRSTKRHIGGDWSATVASGETVTAPQVAAHILTKLKNDAESYLGEEVTDVVITVPAYFSDAQRQATKDAGEIAGLNVARIVNEPTAAALAYGLDSSQEEQTILVFDLGGGTFDVSVLEVVREDDGFSTIQVKATSGDNELGGNDWDQAVVKVLAEEFLAEHGIDLREDPAGAVRLSEAAEQAKVALSAAPETEIHLPYVTVKDGTPLHLARTLSRSEFQKLTADLLDRCRAPFAQVLSDSGVTVDNLDHVVLVGGSTRMPAVSDLIRDLTGGKEPHRGVNPDEVVAAGAAVQAGVLSGEVSDVLLIDVTPLSLGIETRGGLMSTIIERNTAVPVRRTQVFTTGADNQSSVKISVYQGERPMADENTLLGHFKLNGIPPAARAVPQIEVTFDIDANGIVHVAATDLATGSRQSMTVSGSNQLSEADIEKMVATAQEHAARDSARRDRAQAKVDAEVALQNVDAFAADPDAPISSQLRADLDEAAAALWGILDDAAADATAIRAATAKFSRVAHQVGEELYSRVPDPSTRALDDLFADAPAAGPQASADAPDGEPIAEPVEETVEETVDGAG